MTGQRSKVCVRPLGHRTVAWTGPDAFPDQRKAPWCVGIRNPEPACRYLVWRSVPVFDGHRGADCVAIAFLPAQTEGDRIADAIHRETQDSNLRRISILKHDFEPAVAIKVRQREGPAIIAKIQANHSRDVGKCAVSIVGKENIPLMTVPGRVGTDEFIDGAPSALVAGRRTGVRWRFCDHLPPEEARDIALLEARNIAIRNVQIRVTIMVKIPRIGGPRPAAHFNPGLSRLHFEMFRCPGSDTGNCPPCVAGRGRESSPALPHENADCSNTRMPAATHIPAA